ncbi:hypothetical protein [Pleomorphovibrio marinus]|uniref:hypothetical protein n=1 Tax=Pleomorphovibrio marinus TaxID=2164132 RepID=UPI001300873B|nr:hypothetical protein [Pleomorphovibrio marinus]
MLSHMCFSLVSFSNPKEDVVNVTMSVTDKVEAPAVNTAYITPTNIEDLQRVDINDQTLNMTMVSLNVPNGWTLHQDIASNPNGTGYLKFLLAVESPEGEVQGFLPLMMNYNYTQSFGQEGGMYFDQLIYYLMHYCSSPFLEKFSPGSLESDREALQKEEGRQFREHAVSFANMVSQMMGDPVEMDFDMVRLDFSAFRKNIPYKGVIRGAKLGVVDSNPYLTTKFGVVIGGFALAPENLFAQAKNREIDFNMEVSPKWEERRNQIINMETQRMSQDHQARMAQQQQQFNAHQQNMASMRQTYHQQNQAWYDRNFGSSGSGSYSGNAAVTDAITGYSSFNDPYTGQQIKKEGHYNYWYTNEFGEYHGTDDPNFQPENHYSGNWKPIKPLKPEH